MSKPLTVTEVAEMLTGQNHKSKYPNKNQIVDANTGHYYTYMIKMACTRPGKNEETEGINVYALECE
jgi:hypothetical protein